MTPSQATIDGWSDYLAGANNWGRYMLEYGQGAANAYRVAWLRAKQIQG